MMKMRLLLTAAILVTILFLAGCAAGSNPALNTPDGADHIAGFWSGLWQGIISPITFIISLFSNSVNIYEVHNNGGWYDFGFLFGISIAFGGSARAACRR
ncbi:MAG: hypothetical protein TUN42_10570 [Dehalogenimonas sp.]